MSVCALEFHRNFDLRCIDLGLSRIAFVLSFLINVVVPRRGHQAGPCFEFLFVGGTLSSFSFVADMRLPQFEREVIERWVSGVESNVQWARRRADIDLHKRQGGLLGGILSGVGDLLGTNPKTTTTTQAKPTIQTTTVVSKPPPATTTQAVSTLNIDFEFLVSTN